MAEDVADEVARLRSRCDQARDARVRAEHAREQAEQQVAAAVGALRSEFGIETPAQAQELRQALDREIAEEKVKIERALGAT
jgi:hypothetical protein